jgi:hypothetical protein
MSHRLTQLPGKIVIQYRLPFMTIGAILLVIMAVIVYLKASSEQSVAYGVPLLLLLALGVFLAKQTTTFEFDTTRRQFVYLKEYLLVKKETETVAFDQITEVRLSSATDSEGTSYKIRIVTAQHSFLMNDITDKKLAESFVEEIQKAVFGKVAAIEIKEDPVSSLRTLVDRTQSTEVVLSNEQESEVNRLVIANKKIEAIKFVRAEAKVDLAKAKQFVDNYKAE